MSDQLEMKTSTEESTEKEDFTSEEFIKELKKEKGNTSEYKMLVDLIKEMEEMYLTLKEQTESQIQDSFYMKPEILDAVLHISNEDIPELSYDECEEIFKTYAIDDTSIVKLLDNYRRPDEDSEYLSDVGVYRYVLNLLNDLQITLMSSKKEMESLKDESSEILNDFVNYLSSDKVKENRKKRLDMYKAELNKETDEIKRAKMKRMISAMEATNSLSFLFERIERYGKKEIDSIMTSFFDEKRGSYIIDKCKSKLPKFGFDKDRYKFFFNLEETFLPENYHAYNNLFLFCYMRMVAYADPYNKEDQMYVREVTSCMANLIYHKFNGVESEVGFMDIIKKTDDQFKDYYDYFLKNNTTSPNHSVRKEYSLKYEATRKKKLIEKMKEMRIDGYDENMTANELQSYMNDKIDEMVNQKLNEKRLDEEEISTTVSLDDENKLYEQKDEYNKDSKEGE